MNDFLRHLSPSEQVGLLFVGVFGLLLMTSVGALVLSLKDRQEDDVHSQKLREFNGLLRTSWLMCTVFWVGWAAGETVATVLFGIVAFFCTARVHHAFTDPPGRPPQSGDGFFYGAAGAVCAGDHAAL